ncbi:MAG: ComF family protein [Planctomycetes bacterium]|nr:ComF family protein [Planctomycetota bacterium]
MSVTHSMTGVCDRLMWPLVAARRGLLEALLPTTCVGCRRWIGAERGPVCETCQDEIDREMRTPACPRCARAMPTLSIFDKGCAVCKSERHWNLAGTIRVGGYDGRLREMLLRLKYAGGQRESDHLGSLLAARLLECGWLDSIDVIIPVPMHLLRRVQRPCNHAHMLAESCVRALRRLRPGAEPIPLSNSVIQRRKHTPSQTGAASRQMRFENVKGCFAPRKRSSLAGLTVCIIDNLLVSGATITEVAKAARRIGAKRVYGAVIARPPGPGDAPRHVSPELGTPAVI